METEKLEMGKFYIVRDSLVRDQVFFGFNVRLLVLEAIIFGTFLHLGGDFILI